MASSRLSDRIKRSCSSGQAACAQRRKCATARFTGSSQTFSFSPRGSRSRAISTSACAACRVSRQSGFSLADDRIYRRIVVAGIAHSDHEYNQHRRIDEGGRTLFPAPDRRDSQEQQAQSQGARIRPPTTKAGTNQPRPGDINPGASGSAAT